MKDGGKWPVVKSSHMCWHTYTIPFFSIILFTVSCSGPIQEDDRITPWDAPIEGKFDLTLLISSDVRGRISPQPGYWLDFETPPEVSGLAGMSSLTVDIRNEVVERGGRLLLIDGGNFACGTLEGNLTRGDFPVEVMNEMGYDAAIIGPLDLAMGERILESLSSLARFPFVCSNIRRKDSFAGPHYTSPYALFEISSGLTVALICAMSDWCHETLMPAELEWRDTSTAIGDYLKEVQVIGADIAVVLISNAGRSAGSFDMLFPEVWLVPLRGTVWEGAGGVAVDQRITIEPPNLKPCSLWRVDITIEFVDDECVVNVKTSTLLPEQGMGHVSREVAAVIERYSESLRAIADERVGILERTLFHPPLEMAGHSSPLGNFVADALREGTGCHVAFVSRCHVQFPLRKGQVLERDLIEMYPLDETVVTMQLTGAQIRSIIETSLSSEARLLDVSGLTILYRPDAPEGKRVVGIRVGDTSLLDDRDYFAATTSLLGEGKRGHSTFLDRKNFYDTGMSVRQACRKYLQTKGHISFPGEERLIPLAGKRK